MRYLLILAPLALLAATAADPALGDAAQGFGIYRQHPEALQWHAVLLHYAWALFVPGLLALLAPIRHRGAALARASWLAIVAGLATFAALMSTDLWLLALEQLLPDDAVRRANESFESLAWAQWGWQAPGLLGWALSLILTPLAAARARVIDWWTAGAALLGTALYFLFAISPLPLSLAGPAVMLAAYTRAALRLRRPPAEEPDSFGAFTSAAGRACLVLAPVLFAAGLATVPNFSPSLSGSLAHPSLAQASALLLHLCWLAFIPAVLHLARTAPAWSRALSVIVVLALLNFSALMVGDYTSIAAATALDPSTATRVDDRLGTYAPFAFGWVLPGMALTLLGLIAVAVAAAVTRRARWWTPALTAAGIAAFLILGVGPLSLLSPALLLCALAPLARRPHPSPTPAPAHS
ncbi:hypothetical protein AB0M46_25820 [Dactylosporangium sp. NPDC051485]|uniref:hypothetical protein n=1 Tax=Dactylosporangium sp. NPDC051485 TaxID=3154846 RepID=UPI0034349E62